MQAPLCQGSKTYAEYANANSRAGQSDRKKRPYPGVVIQMDYHMQKGRL